MEDTQSPNWENLKYLLKHKYSVYKNGRELGAPVIPLLVHDYSKFKPKNWGPYRDWFFGPEGRLSAEPNPEVFSRFRERVKDHYATENHHMHKRVTPTDLLSIPIDTRKEILADWYSVSKHVSKDKEKFPDIKTWVAEQNYTPILKTAKLDLGSFKHMLKKDLYKAKRNLAFHTKTVKGLATLLKDNSRAVISSPELRAVLSSTLKEMKKRR